MTKKTNHYINNADFLKALIEYRTACDNNQSDGKSDPPIPNYIGECFLKIANHLSRKPNFVSYSFREEMISDGIENCLMYFRNFDPTKSKNPFAYFTQIIYYAFLRRIMKEKKQLYVKYKATQQYGVLDQFEMYEDSNGHMRQFELYDNISEFIQNFEDSREKKKNIKKDKIEELLNLEADIDEPGKD
jgi:hypothetical protein